MLRQDVVAEDLYGDEDTVDGMDGGSSTGVEKGEKGGKGDLARREKVTDRV